MTTRPPASQRQINEWLMSLPKGTARRHREAGGLTRKVVASWLGYETIVAFEKAKHDGWTESMQHRLSRLMTAINDGEVTLDVAPDGCVVMTRAKPPTVEGVRAFIGFDTDTGAPVVTWSRDAAA